MKWTVSCIQMDVTFGDPEANFKHVEEQIKQLMEGDGAPDVIVLPELWTTGYDLTRLDLIGDRNGEDSKTFLAALSKKYGVNLIGGSIAQIKEEETFNTLYAFDRKGNLIADYSKVHLFRLMDEHHHLSAGNTDGMFTMEGVTAAGLICYDIRFPEWVRHHAAKGAEVIYVVAEWPLPRIDHWRSLLIARAIENQCVIVACNRVGSDPNNVFGGHSMVIDPWGTILSEGDETAGIVSAEINLTKVKEIRKHIPVFQDRREDIY